MFSGLFKKRNSTHQSNDVSSKKPSKKITLLVIKSGNDGQQNFYDLFAKQKLRDGTLVHVEQGGWDDIQLTAYSDSKRPVVNLKPAMRPLPKTPQNRVRTIQPDFVLLRELSRGVKPSQDHRNLLYGFMMTQTPSINSLHSMFCLNERPVMQSELIRLNRKYGQEKFPIFTQYYYPMHEEMIITPQYPLVVKMGHGQAGFGKIKVDNHKIFGDVKSMVATTGQYCTAERYIEGKCDLRLQKIGDNYQAYKRTSMSGNWKTNTGTSMIETIEVLPRYRFWMDECSKAFGGGLDICTVDVLVAEEDGKEYILEFNGTASGFGDHEKDNVILRDYVMRKLNEYFVDGDHQLNEQQYLNNDDLVKDIKDEDRYDDEKYVKDDVENEVEDDVQDDENEQQEMDNSPDANVIEEANGGDIADNSAGDDVEQVAKDAAEDTQK